MALTKLAFEIKFFSSVKKEKRKFSKRTSAEYDRDLDLLPTRITKNSDSQKCPIDILSLNLDRSKCWVDITEAKLNHMIDETDAVLQQMCLESDEDLEKVRSLERRVPRVQEMSTASLDDYKRKLDESRSQLNAKMSILEKEMEKVARVRDLRKRDWHLRRQAAIEAFKLERDRELNAPVTKIEDNRNIEIEEFTGSCADESFVLDRSSRGKPSHNREKLAKLRRNIVLNSSSNLNNQNSSGSCDQLQFDQTNSAYYEDYSNASFANTPRSCVSCQSERRSYRPNYPLSSPSQPVTVLIPNRQRTSFASTPRSSARNVPAEHELYSAGARDSRLLMPVVTSNTVTTTTTTTTTNAAYNNQNSPNSIVDESRLLLREYEQLRSDSVSEIQRAHDSLNAR